MDLVSPIIDLLNCIMVPTCNQVEHHRALGERMEELKTKVEELESRKADIERRKLTEVRSDQEVTKEVEHWLGRAEAMITEYQRVVDKFQNVSFLCRSCLSKRVQKKIVEVDRILEKEFPSIAIEMPPARGSILPTDPNAEGDQNRVKFRQNLEEKIMGYLMGDDVGVIGVCGPGGVGKTTLAKSINNKVSNLKDSKFDKVIWAPLPYPFSIVKLQETIVDAMNGNLPERGSEEVRAAKLFEIMGKVKFLLILDDAWDRFSFESVGIPAPTPGNGCKVVVTSRRTQLCKQIGCKDDGIVNVETLSEEESYNLFLDTVGRDVILKVPNLEDTLRDLVKGCAGLPLAIVVIAMSMRGEYDISEWRNALNELTTRVESVRGWDDEMFERLKFSYDRLKDEEIQNCFLFCSLYAKSEKIKKEELIECWIDGGLIKQMKTRKAMVDRARAILNRLISDCLIEDAGKHWYDNAQVIRMHDVMRDMALRVAGSRYLVKASEKVRCITENGEWTEHLEKVSMIDSGISKISPEFCPNCPKLSVLLLSQNRNLSMIPESFFKGMPSLTFLDLSYTRIPALPDSISDLINLTTLLLRGIEELKHVPSLARLKALKKLDLCGAGIEVVPKGIEALVNLQYLNLLCPRLMEFPIRLLKVLSHLEFFAANFSSCWSNTSFVMEAKQIPSRLGMLETFIGNFDNLDGFNNYVEFFHQHQKPTMYLLHVGYVGVLLRSILKYDSVHNLKGSKKVVIRGSDIQEKHAVVLPNDLQQLEIQYCNGVGSLSETSLPYTETDLRSCVISGGSFEYILDLGSPSSSVCRLFDKCEVLHLSYMRELRALVKGAPQTSSALSTSSPPSIFSNIKTFEIKGCPRIKKFPSDLLKRLPNLEEILVSDCKRMEEIIESEGEEKETVLTGGKNEITVTFNLAKLRKLVLRELPKLKRICGVNGVMVCDSIQTIDISRCPRLRRIPLDLPQSSPPPSLQEIKLDSREMWELLKWENPTTKEILLPFFKPRSDARSLNWEFDGLQDFNSFLYRFQDENLNSYEFIVKPIGDEDGGNVDKSLMFTYYRRFVGIFKRDSSKIVALHGVQVNVDQMVLLPNGVRCLEIINCRGMKSGLCELKTEAMNLASCVVKQCGELECMLPSSSTCSILDGLQSLMLAELPNLQVLVRMENQAIPTPLPSIFSNLKHFQVYQCPRIKKLFSSELLIGLRNLEKIWIEDCAEMEEIIEVGEEEGEKEAITFTLPKLKQLCLWKLPKLKSMCSARGVMVCDSLETIAIGQCEMLTRIPLDLPLLPDGQLSPPPSLKRIYIDSTEWWESLQWDKPAAKDILTPFLKV